MDVYNVLPKFVDGGRIAVTKGLGFGAIQRDYKFTDREEGISSIGFN
jgi:hypothetical protein